MKKLLMLVVLVLMLGLNVKANPNKMVAIILLMEHENDEEIVMTIFTSLETAEKVANLLDVEMISSNSVEDDVFVFALKSEEQKELTLKMFDEEGYELAAHRVLKIEQGNTYKALNVETLENGEYILKLEDSEGHELTKKLTINR